MRNSLIKQCLQQMLKARIINFTVVSLGAGPLAPCPVKLTKYKIDYKPVCFMYVNCT